MKGVIIGIDEAGRGPLAGPLAVGAVCFHTEEALLCVRGVTDSKVMTPLSRVLWRKRIERLAEEGVLTFSVVFVTPAKIDKWGMSKALRYAVAQNLKKLSAGINTSVLLDGSLYAPKKFINQQTIIKGDLLEPAISTASVMAKVYRDEYMECIALKYPEYAFDIHKGYGTSVHIEAIRKHGLSPIHRRSFCRNVAKKQYI